MSTLQITIDGQPFTVEMPTLMKPGQPITILVDGQPVTVLAPENDSPELLDWLMIDGHPMELVVAPDLRQIRSRYGLHHVEIHDSAVSSSRPVSGDGRVKAPIPGLIGRILVAPGQTVKAGDRLIILEAMKMENEVRAPRDGTILSISVNLGQTVTLGLLLLEIG